MAVPRGVPRPLAAVLRKTSRKQRLIQALNAERIEFSDNPSAVYVIDSYLWALQNRGSGPLPLWLRQLAYDRGIE